MTHHHSEMLTAPFNRTPGRREDEPDGDPFEADPRKSAKANRAIDEAESIDGSGAPDAVTGSGSLHEETELERALRRAAAAEAKLKVLKK